MAGNKSLETRKNKVSEIGKILKKKSQKDFQNCRRLKRLQENGECK